MYVASQLGVDESTYSRWEKGKIRINMEKWEKIARTLNVSVKEIFEPDENRIFICGDSVSGNRQGANNIYPVPDFLLDTQKKYIQKLEEEILLLKERLKKYEGAP